MKKVECCECGKLVEVPDDIDPEQEAVFCSQKCIDAESERSYVDENRQIVEERENEDK